jgi:uncharacterized DUF497 family protein
MDYIWDSKKRLSNLLKHGVEFSDAVLVFEDDLAITIEDSYQNEQRFITLGCDAHNRTLIVVYTHKNDFIRIISARKANKTETSVYKKGGRYEK